MKGYKKLLSRMIGVVHWQYFQASKTDQNFKYHKISFEYLMYIQFTPCVQGVTFFQMFPEASRKHKLY